jgi:glycosyltransferase involved in cell wall biosynthesis
LAQGETIPFEVVVVDSEADDEVVDAAQAFPAVRIIRSREGLRPGPARNLGARHARGDFLLFLDADCTCMRGSLAAAVFALEKGARGVGGPVLHGKPWHPVAAADNFLQFADLPASRPRGPAGLLPSCNLAVRRVDFEELSGFAPYAAGEDALFCAAFTRRWGGGLQFEPGMQVRHFGRTHLRDFWRHQELFGRMRGELGIELTARQRRLGRLSFLAPAIGAKRLTFLLGRAWAAGPATFIAALGLLPWLAFGLTAWCVGFRRGCHQTCPEPNYTTVR